MWTVLGTCSGRRNDSSRSGHYAPSRAATGSVAAATPLGRILRRAGGCAAAALPTARAESRECRTGRSRSCRAAAAGGGRASWRRAAAVWAAVGTSFRPDGPTAGTAPPAAGTAAAAGTAHRTTTARPSRGPAAADPAADPAEDPAEDPAAIAAAGVPGRLRRRYLELNQRLQLESDDDPSVGLALAFPPLVAS